jgi:hypothetical protein
MNGDMSDRERRIRERAYQLWQLAGQPAGRDDEFWHHAEAEVGAEDQARQVARDQVGPGGRVVGK